MKFRILPLLFVLTLVSCSTPAEIDESDVSENETSQSPTGEPNGLVPPIDQAFKGACEEDQSGPWDNDLVLNWMDEQGRIEGEEEILVKSGGVPTVIQNEDGDLIAAFQWFPCENEEAFDQVAVVISKDDGETWSEPEPIVVEDFPEGYQRPFDPTLALLPDGRIRIYYTSNANGMTTFGDDTNIYSAISEDGINYTFEEGVRFDLDGSPAYDSAVGYWDGFWHIITPNNVPTPSGGAHHAISSDGLTFTQTDDILTDAEVNWTGNLLAREDGLYFYGTDTNGKGIWYSSTADGESWEEPSYTYLRQGDPAVLCVEEDCLVVSVKMELKVENKLPQ